MALLGEHLWKMPFLIHGGALLCAERAPSLA